MALGRCYKLAKIIILTIAAATVVAAVFGVLYYSGAFLPRWIEWKDNKLPYDIGENVKVQDFGYGDIDMDGEDELIVLCWKIGKYGERKPFWIKRDERRWSQHFYIYEVKENKITPKWMASDIHQDVKSFSIYGDIILENVSPDQNVSYWMWDTWGLYRVEKDDADKIVSAYKEKKDNKVKKASEQNVNSIQETTTESVNADTSVLDEDAKEENTVSIIMAGDILLHDGVNKACRRDDGVYDYSVLFENTKNKIEAADIAIVNQEVIIGGEELNVTGYPSFNAPYEIGDALVDAGFDVVCHATNHALDRGKRGIQNCIAFWKNKYPDMVVLGIHDSDDNNSNVHIQETNGIKIAILNYTYGTNGIALPNDMPYAVSLLDDNKLIEDLAYAEEVADFTVVCPHWGTEYRLEPDDYQKSKATLMVANGADLIIGTHPHVVEPVEWVEAENGNMGLCYYSLGNYVNWTSGRGENVSNRMVGALADVTITMEDDDICISDFSVIPIVSHVEGRRFGVTTYLLEDYTDEMSMQNEIIQQDKNFNLEYCNRLIQDVFKNMPLVK